MTETTGTTSWTLALRFTTEGVRSDGHDHLDAVAGAVRLVWELAGRVSAPGLAGLDWLRVAERILAAATELDGIARGRPPALASAPPSDTPTSPAHDAPELREAVRVLLTEVGRTLRAFAGSTDARTALRAALVSREIGRAAEAVDP